MATLISNASGNLTGAATFAAAETGTGALNLIRNSTNTQSASTVTSSTFTVTNGKVIDAVILWIENDLATVATGTLKVELLKGGVSQASVTVNKTDLGYFTSSNTYNIGPVLFKFTGTATGDGGSNWTIATTVTGSNTLRFWFNGAASNHTRALRTTTAATPAAADDLYIVGELTGAGTNTPRTVTMDSTAATAYGSGLLNSNTVAGGGIHISNYGTLTYGTTAGSNYVLRINGDVIVYQFGTLNMGSTQGSSGGFATWDNATATAVTLSGGNLVATNTGTSSADQGARGATSAGKTSGKYYFEITSTTYLGGGNNGLGIGTTASTYTGMGNSATTGVNMYISDGSIYANGSSAGVAIGGLSSGTLACIAVDLDNRKIWFRKTISGNWNNSGTANPATNVGGITIPAGTMVPFCTFGGTGGGINNVLTANFGASAFSGAVPSGFTSGWDASISASTAVLEFQQASADGDFGLRCLDNSVVTITGQSRTAGKNVVQCKLTSNLAAAGTTLNVTADTGWLNGDQVCVASTTRTASECELVTLSGNAGASSFTISPGATNAHSGTAPTQAEIGLITRNVRIRSTSPTLMSYMYCTALATVTVSWAEFYYVGATGANKRGIEIDGGAVTNPKSVTYCSLHDLDNNGLYCNASGVTSLNLTFSNNVGWLSSAGTFITINGSITNTDWTLDSNLMMRSTSHGFLLNDVGGTCTNNTLVGTGGGYGLNLAEAPTTPLPLGTFSGNTVHSGSGGLLFGVGSGGGIGVINNLTAWRNTGNGLNLNSFSTSDVSFSNLILFGNSAGAQGNINLAGGDVININGGLIAADTTFPVTNGIVVPVFNTVRFNFASVDMSGNGSIYAPHTTNDFLLNTGFTASPQGQFNNCKFGAPNIFNARTNWTKASYLGFEKYNQTAGDHRTEMTYGQLRTDSTSFRTAAPSMRMTPNSASNRLESAPQGRGIQCAVNSGSAVSVGVWLRKDSTYTGNQPRLIQRANAALGQNSDVVLATYSAGTGAWNQLTATSSTATGDDGVWEFVVDCDGTAGFINVDDWSFTGAGTDSAGLKNWFNGLPVVGGAAGGTAAGGGYFSVGFV